MGQIISCVWRCVRSKFRNETKTLVDPSHEQPSHYITIPDGEVEPVSSSIPEYVTDLTPDVEENCEKLIRVVEEKIVDEKEANNKVYDQVIKETCIRRIGVYSSKQNKSEHQKEISIPSPSQDKIETTPEQTATGKESSNPLTPVILAKNEYVVQTTKSSPEPSSKQTALDVIVKSNALIASSSLTAVTGVQTPITLAKPSDFNLRPNGGIPIPTKPDHHSSVFPNRNEMGIRNPQSKGYYLVYNPQISIRRIGEYTSKQKILLVGEGNFSFSSSLAVAFASASNVVATSLDSQEFLIKNYNEFMMNKANVESRGGVLMHGVNVKSMNKDPVLGSLKFDRIIYNFPHTGDFGRTQIDLRNNKELVRGFIRNAKKMINDDGEIHIRHKTNGFFLLWDIPKIGSDQGLFLIRNPKFHRSEYPGYHTKYGFGGNKDFDSTPSRTYIFGLFP